MVADNKRRVLVTGGGRGLGAAIVHALADAGHDVTFTYRSADAEAEALVNELSIARPEQKFAARPLDLADKAAIDALVKALEADAPYSGFVHNAGQSYDTLAMMIDQAKAETAMQVNVWSFMRLAGALVRPMMRARDGRVVAREENRRHRMAAHVGGPGVARRGEQPLIVRVGTRRLMIADRAGSGARSKTTGFAADAPAAAASISLTLAT